MDSPNNPEPHRIVDPIRLGNANVRKRHRAGCKSEEKQSSENCNADKGRPVH